MKCNLDGPECSEFKREELKIELQWFSKRLFNVGSFMVWAGFAREEGLLLLLLNVIRTGFIILRINETNSFLLPMNIYRSPGVSCKILLQTTALLMSKRGCARKKFLF